PAWVKRVEDHAKAVLSALSVRYAVGWRDLPVRDGWRLAAKMRGCGLRENTRVIERAFVPKRVTIGLNGPAMMKEMTAASDFRERAWIEASVKPYERENGPGSVTLQRRRAGYDIVANMERDGWVVVSESAWKGWR